MKKKTNDIKKFFLKAKETSSHHQGDVPDADLLLYQIRIHDIGSMLFIAFAVGSFTSKLLSIFPDDFFLLGINAQNNIFVQIHSL